MNQKMKTAAFMMTGFFVLVGVYNAVVINSDSHLAGTEIRPTKRLDEVLGVTVKGRKLASEVQWHKLTAPQAKVQPPQVAQAPDPVLVPAFEDTAPLPAIQEDLTLSLVEVINPKVWKNGLTNNQFNGSILTREGVIESLEISLPEGLGFSASFTELTGNVFEYDLNGEVYSGMMYQVDQNAYMVTLSNGPLEGTRFRFSASSPSVERQDTQDTLAKNGIEAGVFGEAGTQENDHLNDLALQQEGPITNGDIRTTGFNL